MEIALPKTESKVEDKKKIICSVEDSGAIDVELIGPHMDKRTLLRVIKAIKLEYRKSIILYRKQMMADRIKKEQKNKIETNERISDNGHKVTEQQ